MNFIDNIEILKDHDRVELVNGVCICINDSALTVYTSIFEAEQKIHAVSHLDFPHPTEILDTWPLTSIAALDSIEDIDVVSLANGYDIIIDSDIMRVRHD